MGIMEIILVILGVVVFVGSFLLPEGKKTDSQSSQMSEEIIHEMVEKEVEDAKSQIGDIVDETIIYAMEKTERSMDRLTNEKMLAVNEYSDTVLEEINKNHKEVVFLYDMLNDKHENLKSTVSEAAKMAGEVKQTVKDAELLAKEVESNAAKEAESAAAARGAELTAARRAEIAAKKAEIAALEAAKEAGVSIAPAGSLAIEARLRVEEATPEPEFTPIKAEKVELLYPLPEAEEREAEAPSSMETMGAVIASKPAEPAPEAVKGNAFMTAGTPEVEVTLNADGKRNSNERILEMHKAGKSNMAIAKELGLGIGEVKLVIDLFEGL